MPYVDQVTAAFAVARKPRGFSLGIAVTTLTL